LPCGAEEPVDDPIEEPVESKIYLPLFGEYETMYNIFTTCGVADIVATDSLYYTGEKIVDEKTYKVFNNGYYSYCLRTTDDNSKVYLLDQWRDKEVLMFDLLLEEGDYFTYPEGLSFQVESVYIDKKGRKNILLSHYNWYDEVLLKFIEGVGSSAGFFDSSGFDVLLCSTKDGESTYFYYNDFQYEAAWDKRSCVAYVFSQKPACSFRWVDVDDASLSGDWLVYPNPFSETFYVRHETERIEQLCVYNEAGQLILKKEINDTEARIDLSAPPGVYYVSIITETGKRYHKKMIKQ